MLSMKVKKNVFSCDWRQCRKTRSTHYHSYLILIYIAKIIKWLENIFHVILFMKDKLIIFLLHILYVYILSGLSYKCMGFFCFLFYIFYHFVMPSQSNRNNNKSIINWIYLYLSITTSSDDCDSTWYYKPRSNTTNLKSILRTISKPSE